MWRRWRSYTAFREDPIADVVAHLKTEISSVTSSRRTRENTCKSNISLTCSSTYRSGINGAVIYLVSHCWHSPFLDSFDSPLNASRTSSTLFTKPGCGPHGQGCSEVGRTQVRCVNDAPARLP